ncbi:MAG: ATP-binding protein [Bradymonadaceae bacterium]
MSADPLIVEDVEVDRLRGFDGRGFLLEELSSALNVVYGPNASGKTTLGVALERLLWPRELTDGRQRLRGTYRLGADRWRVEIDGPRLTRHHASDAAPPTLPPADHRHRYHLYLPDLLESEDAAFAETIQRRAAGGYDLDAAAEALGFGPVHPRSGDLTERVDDLRHRLDELRTEQRKLRDRADGLEALKEERRRLETERDRSEARLDQIEAAIDVAQSRERLERARDRLESFSDAHAALDGTEAERLRTLRDNRANLQREIEEREEETERVEREIASDPLPDGGLPDRLVETIAEEVDELDDLHDRLDAARQAVADARRRRQRLESRLEGVADAERAQEVEPQDLEAVREHARSRAAVRADREVLDQLQHVFEETDAPDRSEIEQLRAGTSALRKWLRAHARSDAAGDLPLLDLDLRHLVLGSGLLLLLVGIGLAVAVHLAGLVVVLVGLALLAAWLTLDDASGTAAETYRQEVEEELAIDAPEAWEADADYLVQGTIYPELRERLGLNLDRELTALQAVDHLLEVQRAGDELESNRREVDRLEDEVKSRLDSLTDRLDPVDVSPPEAVPEASAVVEQLRSARSARRDAESRLDETRRELERDRDELAGVEAEIEDIFDRANLDTGSFAQLQRLCDQHDEWTDATERVREAEVAHEQRRDDFDALDGADESLLERGADELRDRAAALEETLDELTEELEQTREEITDLEQRVERAKSSRDIERTSEDYRRARGRLERERRDDYRSLAGHHLVAFIRDQSRQRQLPAVFDRADALFARATNGRYALDFDAPSASFLARDTVRERVHPVDELSSGTRIQLSLAVRMAFVDLQETGAAPPLVLDETLANSDDVRAMELIETIADFARDGRQIFYLTAQRDEVAKWRAHLEDGELSFRLHQLDGAGDASTRETRPRPNVVPDETDVPRPDGRSHAEYGRSLDVPEWSPHEPVGQLHLWHVVEDVESLYALLDAGLERWGQLDALAARGGGGAVGLDEEELDRIRARARAVDAYREAALVGRNEPITVDVVRQSDAISENFLDRDGDQTGVDDLLEREEVDGDPEAVLSRLDEVQYLHEEAENAFERELVDAGYVDRRDRLTPDEIWSRVLAESDDALADGLLDTDDLRDLLRRLDGTGLIGNCGTKE